MSRKCPVCCTLMGDRYGNAEYCFRCLNATQLLKDRAHRAVYLAIRKGQLPPPATQLCVVCDEPAEVYDHRDYEQPLKVKPVCRSCNRNLGSAKQLRPGAIRHYDVTK